jgi:hypothetical protein
MAIVRNDSAILLRICFRKCKKCSHRALLQKTQECSHREEMQSSRRTPSHPYHPINRKHDWKSSTPDVLQTSLSIYQFKSALSRKSAPPLAFTSFRRPCYCFMLLYIYNTIQYSIVILRLYTRFLHL